MHTIIPTRHYLKIVLSASLVLVAALICFLVVARQAHAESTTGATNAHIITVYDDGTEKGFMTTKATLKEALAEAGIVLDAKDRTEPSLDQALVASSYQVNLYRARPVVIRDGASETKVITSYRTGKQIAKEAGLQLRDEDQATLSTATDISQVGAAEVLSIRRAMKVNVVFYGQPLEVYTFASTVAELLKQKAIVPQANDTLVPGPSVRLTADMRVELWRNGEQTVNVEEAVAYPVEQIKDANQSKGYKEVKTAGVDGSKTVTYKITMQNGKEVKREVINSVTTKEPVKQVEVIGVKVNLPTGSHTDWMAAAGIAESDYGYAEWLIQKESGWNPSAMNRSSGACGLVQALPCSKLGPNWDDPVVALRWGDAYVKGRYGGWAGAYAFWTANRWY